MFNFVKNHPVKQFPKIYAYVIWFILFASLTLIQVRSAKSMDLGQIQLIRGALLLSIVGFVFLTAMLTKSIRIFTNLFSGLLYWYSFYVLVALFSTIYSGYPFLTLSKAFELVTDIVAIGFVVVIIRSEKDIDNFWLFTVSLLFLLILYYIGATVFLGMKFFTYRFDSFPRWNGVGHPNSTTQIGAILGIVSLSRSFSGKKKYKKYWYFLFIFSLIVILISRARTSIFIFILLFLLTLLIYGKKKEAILISLLGAILIGWIYNESIFQFLLRGQNEEQFYNMSGRVDKIWIGAWSLFIKSPLIGHGYYYTPRILAGKYITGSLKTEFSNVDNTFLEILISMGIVGIIPIIIMFIILFKKIWILRDFFKNPYDHSYFVEVSLVMLSTFIRSWVNPTIQNHHWNSLVFLAGIIIIQYTVNDSNSNSEIQGAN